MAAIYNHYNGYLALSYLFICLGEIKTPEL